MGKKIVSKHFQVRRTIEGTNTSVDFVPNIKTKVAPEIVESFMSDDGNIMHILDNGNQISDNNYMAHWGQPKGTINWGAKVVKENPNKFTKNI